MWPHRQLKGLAASPRDHLALDGECEILNRRKFLAASAMASVVASLPAQDFAPVPLRAQPKHRRIFPKREERGSWLMHGDGPYEPRKVIRSTVIEDVFGAGTYNQLSQRDQWEMIEAGWFTGDDLHLPVPLGDDTYLVWKGYYHPVSEAHDLLRDLFATRYSFMMFGAWYVPNGMTLAEHPSTPRYATARVESDLALVRCHFDVASFGSTVELVLPDELHALRNEYSRPDRLEELMWRTKPRDLDGAHNLQVPRSLTTLEKMRLSQEASKRRELTARQTTAPSA